MAEVRILGGGGETWLDPADVIHYGMVAAGPIPDTAKGLAYVLHGPMICGPVSILRSDHDEADEPHAHAYCHQCEASSDPVAVLAVAPSKNYPIQLHVWAFAHRCEETR